MGTKLKSYIFVALGCLIIGFIFYFRVIYVRLPRDIVHQYNWLILLSYISFFIFNLIRAGGFDFILLFFPQHNSESKYHRVITTITSTLYKPFTEMKTLYLTWSRARIMLANVTVLHYVMLKYSCYLPYIIFNILPRLIFLVALSIDFWNLYFYRIYQALPLLLIPITYEIIMRFANEITIEFLKESHENTFSFLWVFDKGFVFTSLIGPSSHFTMQPWAQPFPGVSREEFTHFFHRIFKAAIFSTISLNVSQYDPDLVAFNICYYYCCSLLWGLILLTILLS